MLIILDPTLFPSPAQAQQHERVSTEPLVHESEQTVVALAKIDRLRVRLAGC